MEEKINLAEKLALVNEYWSPVIVGRLNDYKIQVVKVKGEFTWHTHAGTDEFFLVLDGELAIRLRDREVRLNAGEVFVVPRGVSDQDAPILKRAVTNAIGTGARPSFLFTAVAVLLAGAIALLLPRHVRTVDEPPIETVAG